MTKYVSTTISIPETYETNIQKLVKLGHANSRSDAIRSAVHEFLIKEFANLKLMGGNIS